MGHLLSTKTHLDAFSGMKTLLLVFNPAYRQDFFSVVLYFCVFVVCVFVSVFFSVFFFLCFFPVLEKFLLSVLD